VWIDQVRRLANLGRLREAGDACAAALDQYRTSAEIIYLHAILLSEAGRHADAAVAARRALYLDRTMIVGHLALGSALRRTGDMAGARLAFVNAVALLDGMSPEAIVPASGGEPAARLAAAARVQRSLAEQAA
jgi:chemotaxis protein methyltransferase CheR